MNIAANVDKHTVCFELSVCECQSTHLIIVSWQFEMTKYRYSMHLSIIKTIQINLILKCLDLFIRYTFLKTKTFENSQKILHLTFKSENPLRFSNNCLFEIVLGMRWKQKWRPISNDIDNSKWDKWRQRWSDKVKRKKKKQIVFRTTWHIRLHWLPVHQNNKH